MGGAAGCIWDTEISAGNHEPGTGVLALVTEEEFDVFYAAAFPRLVGQLYALTGDHSEAQDVVQEAFVRAWDRRGALLAEGAPEAWIRTVAVRLAVCRSAFGLSRSDLAAWAFPAVSFEGRGTSVSRSCPLKSEPLRLSCRWIAGWRSAGPWLGLGDSSAGQGGVECGQVAGADRDEAGESSDLAQPVQHADGKARCWGGSAGAQRCSDGRRHSRGTRRGCRVDPCVRQGARAARGDILPCGAGAAALVFQCQVLRPVLPRFAAGCRSDLDEFGGHGRGLGDGSRFSGHRGGPARARRPGGPGASQSRLPP